MRTSEQRPNDGPDVVLAKGMSRSSDNAGDVRALSAVSRELAAHPFGGRVLVAKRIGMSRFVAGTQEIHEPEREKRPVAEACVGRRRRVSAREAPEEHRVRQSVPFRTSLR